MQRESSSRNPSHDVATERLFIALTLPSAVRDALLALVQPLPGVSWTRPEQLHVTLRFLGDLPTVGSAEMIARLSAIRVAPFILPLETVGAFPPKRAPRVIWVGTGSGHPRLFQLRQRVDDALIASGIEVDVRTFHPHITVARCADNAAAAVGHWLHAHRDFAAPSFRVESFDLYASDLRPSGAVHTLKQSFPLG
jgi:RNA 2',3'-cyclic 3'-phosphodiesterase